MNFQILPNWCKKLGVATFIVFSFLEGIDSFIKGALEGFSETSRYNLGNEAFNKEYSLKENGIFSFEDYFGEKIILLFGALALVGMLIYVLSKEKIEDDYINKLRLESYQLSFIFVTFIALVLYLLGFNSNIDIGSVIFLLLGIYLIIFAIKKRAI